MAIVTALPGEQGVPDIEDARLIPWQKYGMIAACTVLACSYGYMEYATSETPENPPTKVAEISGPSIPARTFDTQPVYVEPPAPAMPVEAVGTAVVVAPVQAEPVIIYRDRPAPAVPPAPRIDKGRSVAMVGTSSQTAPINAPTAMLKASGEGSMPAVRQSVNYATDGVERGYASTLSNTDRLVLQGVVIPCTLNNAINTQLSGNASCTVARDIWSADNSQILIAKGSRANGTYQIETTSGAVTRIGVQWGRIRTTDNQVALLDSPASDQQGATGIPADSVNYHFWAKFGSSLAVSLIEGVFSTVGSTGNAGDVVVNSATGTSSDLASQVLASTVNLPATRKANAGSDVAIVLQRDIEFGAAR